MSMMGPHPVAFVHRPVRPVSNECYRQGKDIMVERRIELNRRYRRKKKMTKLKAKLAAAKDGREKEAILLKIHFLSPWWQEPEAVKA